VQGSFAELGTPLRDVTFCVVDLETTGGSAAAGSSITEVGAVKVRGGEVLAEFQTLVDPGQPIPPFVAVLTGITDAAVVGAPSIGQVLPAFLEFARGCVLVAHNAPFDVGFLRHFAQRLGYDWPAFEVLDTAVLARRVLTRDDAPDCRLATLARVLRARPPDHRALHDARAAVDVLHGLIERVGGLGISTLPELQAFSAKVSAVQRAKRHLADSLPRAPGVYLFLDGAGRALYIGTSKDLRSRVRSYFTASETRSRMGEMIGLAERVSGIECATALEAQVRELRLIAQHQPRYNRRSRFPQRQSWVKLTAEPWPRLSIVSQVIDGTGAFVGPFSSRRSAELAVAALHEAFPVRQCSGRLPRRPSRSACMLAQLRRCLSPCDGSVEAPAYAAQVGRLSAAMLGSPAEVVAAVEARMAALAAAERFEDAQVHRDRLLALLRGAARSQRLTAISRCAELVAARRVADGRWEVHVVRYGRLAAAGVIPPGVDAGRWVSTLRAGAETARPGPAGTPAATVEEAEIVLRWLEQPGVRLVHLEGTWACPVGGAERWLAGYGAVRSGGAALVAFDDRRDLRPVHQPAR
jgi:DNA polymerase-3 subunit epsilon